MFFINIQSTGKQVWAQSPSAMNFLPWFSPLTCTGVVTCKFTDHSEYAVRFAIRLLLLDASVILKFLWFKAKHIIGIPLSYRSPKRYPLRVIPHCGVYFCARKIHTFWCEQFCDTCFCWRFPSSITSSLILCRSDSERYPYLRELKFMRLEVLVYFVHRVGHKYHSTIALSKCFLMLSPYITKIFFKVWIFQRNYFRRMIFLRPWDYYSLSDRQCYFYIHSS